MGDQKWRFLLWSGVLMLFYVYSLVPALFLGLLVDFFTSYEQGESLWFPFFIIGVFGSSYALISILRLSTKHIVNSIIIGIESRARRIGIRAILDQSLSYHQEHMTGGLIQRVLTAGGAARSMLFTTYNNVYVALVTFVGVVIFYLFLDLRFVLFAIGYMIAIIGNEWFWSRRIAKWSKQVHKAREEATGSMTELGTGIQALKAHGATGSLHKHHEERENKLEKLENKLAKDGARKWMGIQVIFGIGTVVFLYLTVNALVAQSITVGMILVLWNYYKMLSDQTRDVSNHYTVLLEKATAIAPLSKVLIEQAKDGGSESFPSRWKSITFSNLAFGYKDEVVLSVPKLTIHKGEHIGIIGPSGGGKSTLLKLLAGLYPQREGSIRISNTTLGDIKHEERTSNIRLVLQETELFSLPLRDNITLMEEISNAQLLKVLEICQLEDLVNKLPEGVDTKLGSGGHFISGGEKQRIGLARALIKDPSILLLDEATSALDKKTELAVMKAIHKHYPKTTILAIAHRTESLKSMSRFLEVRKGEVREIKKTTIK